MQKSDFFHFKTLSLKTLAVSKGWTALSVEAKDQKGEITSYERKQQFFCEKIIIIVITIVVYSKKIVITIISNDTKNKFKRLEKNANIL